MTPVMSVSNVILFVSDFQGKRFVSEISERRLCFCRLVICHIKFAIIKFDRLLFIFSSRQYYC